MADETNPPNDPSSQNKSSKSLENSQKQADIAKQLNESLDKVSSNLNKITSFTQSQAELLSNLSSEIDKINSTIEKMSGKSVELATNITQAAEKTLEHFSVQNFQNINQSLMQVASTSMSGITMQTQMFGSLTDSTGKYYEAGQTLSEQFKESSDTFKDAANQAGDAVEDFTASTEDFANAIIDLGEQTKKTNEKIENLNKSGLSKLKGFSKGILGVASSIGNSMMSMVSSGFQFVKFTATLPFTIMNQAAKIGNEIRSELVETVQSAAESLKEKFDLSSHIGQGIVKMAQQGKGMLMSFQSPSSELVKLFGYGAQGIANMIGFMGENIDAMGHFAEVFGNSLTKDKDNLKNFTRMVKGMGLSSEDVAYLSMDAANNMKHVNVRMAELGVTLEEVSKEYQVDRKRLSKNVMLLRRDIIQFGHLSDEEIARTTARLTHLKVKLEDAGAVFKKFSTFEDAANSVAMLSQTFGMNLDAMDMIQAQNPEEIIDMFRNSMLETGRSFQDLNRFEKDLMAQHTGMSAESLSALMNYRDLGLTHKEAVDKMNAEKPEAKQMKALKELNSAIKEVQKVLQFTSPFKAFADGLLANSTLTGDMRDALTGISNGYEGLYEYAKNLKPEVWRGILEPIKLVVSVMREIFESKTFKKGLINTLSAISNFVADMFGVTSEDVMITNMKSNIKHVLGSKDISKENKTKFKGEVQTQLHGILNKNKAMLSTQIKGFQDLLNNKDPQGMLDALLNIVKDPNTKKEIRDQANKIIREMSGDLSTITTIRDDTTIVRAYGDASQQLVESVGDTAKLNEGNASKLMGISRNVMGAIIKGAGTAFLTMFRLINDGVDAAAGLAKKSSSEQTNAIAEFLKIDPQEFAALGNSMNNAIRGLLNRKGKMLNIASWIIGGFKDVFAIIIDVFLITLKSGLKSIFGGMFDDNKMSTATALRVTKFDDKAKDKARIEVPKSLEKNKEISVEDAAAFSYSLEEKISRMGFKQDKKMMTSALAQAKKRFKESGGTAADSKRFVEQIGVLLSQIDDKGNFTGRVRQRKVATGKRDAQGNRITKTQEYIEGDVHTAAANFQQIFNGILETFRPTLAGGAPLFLNIGQDFFNNINSLKLMSEMSYVFRKQEVDAIKKDIKNEMFYTNKGGYTLTKFPSSYAEIGPDGKPQGWGQTGSAKWNKKRQIYKDKFIQILTKHLGRSSRNFGQFLNLMDKLEPAIGFGNNQLHISNQKSSEVRASASRGGRKPTRYYRTNKLTGTRASDLSDALPKPLEKAPEEQLQEAAGQTQKTPSSPAPKPTPAPTTATPTPPATPTVPAKRKATVSKDAINKVKPALEEAKANSQKPVEVNPKLKLDSSQVQKQGEKLVNNGVVKTMTNKNVAAGAATLTGENVSNPAGSDIGQSAPTPDIQTNSSTAPVPQQ